MKKVYKITLVVAGALVVLLLVAGHLFPMVFYRIFIKPKASQTINMDPTFMSQMPNPPGEWKRVGLGDISLRLPMSDLKSVKSGLDSSMLFFHFTDWRLTASRFILSDLEKELHIQDKMPSFSEMIAAYSVTARDLSVFHSPISNYRTLVNLIVKGMLPPLKKIIVFETAKIRGYLLVMRDANMITCSIYRPDSERNLSINLTSTNALDVDDALRIIGGIEMSAKTIDEDKYHHDLRQFQERHGIVIEELSQVAPPTNR